MNKLKVCNLYSGLGGNRKLWTDCDVTAVELDPEIAKIYQSYFPDDTVIVGDAHQYLLDHYKEFDFIWASPPCPSHSRMMKFTRHDYIDYPDMRLYQEILLLNNFFEGMYCVENVNPYYKPLIDSSAIIDRHLYWANFRIGKFDTPKFNGNYMKAKKADLMDYYGLHYKHNVYLGSNDICKPLRNCVHPETGLYILNCARNIITKSNVNQLDLF